jgi:HK97 family phage prohead protease
VKSFYEKKLNAHPEINVKDIDTEKGIISVYYSAFDIKDRDEDVMIKGSFKKTIKEQGPQGIGEVWHLLMHDPNQHVARPFELGEDSYGLLSRVKMPDTTRGKDTLNMYLEGHYKHHSFGFQILNSQNKGNYREITEVRLFEGSSVLWAANPAAVTANVKSLSKDELTSELDITIKSLRNGKYTDETFGLLEIKLRQIQQAIADFTKVTEPEVKSTLPIKEVELLNALTNINQTFKSTLSGRKTHEGT